MSEEVLQEEAPKEVEPKDKALEELLEKIPKYTVGSLEKAAVRCTTEPEKDPFEAKVYWPGKVNYYGERGAYTGGKMVRIQALIGGTPDVDAFNKFFEDHPEGLCCYHEVLANGTIVFIYTNRLTPEEQEEYEAFNREVDGKMAEWRTSRADAKRKGELEQELAWDELVRRARIGEKYEWEIQPNLKKAKKEKK